MQVRADQIEAQLARGLKPLYTVHGDEPLLAQEAGDAIRAAARAAGYGERKVFTVSGAHFDWSGLLGASQAMSLFAERQLIEIRIPSGKPGKDGSEALQRYCDALSDDVMPFRPGTVPDHPLHVTGRRVRDALVGAGLFEVRPLPFVAGQDETHARVANPLADDEPHPEPLLRPPPRRVRK